MNPFEAIGDFFGGLFGQKKKKDETASRPVAIQRPQAPVVVDSPLNQQNQATVVDPSRPEAPKPTSALAGGVTVQATPLDGLSDEDRATAQKITATGKDPTAFIKAARSANTAQEQSRWDNSLLGKASNFGAEVGKILNAGNEFMGNAYGTALASVSPEVRAAERAAQAERDTEAQITSSMAARLRDPSTDPAQRQRVQNFLIKQAGAPVQPTEMDKLHQDMLAKTDPAGVLLNSAGVALTPFVGGLTGAGAKTAVGTGINTVVDPLTLLSKIPSNSVIGRVLNAEIDPSAVTGGIKQVSGRIQDGVDRLVDGMNERYVERNPGTGFIPSKVAREPYVDSPITSSQPTVKAPAITSPNRPIETTPAIQEQSVLNMPEQVAPQPEVTAPTVIPKETTAQLDELFPVTKSVVETPNVPTLRAFGREIPMTEENGYMATATPDRGTVYSKQAQVGSNRKGDRTFQESYYDANGFKLTKAQHDAMVNGELASSKPKVTQKPVETAPKPETVNFSGKPQEVVQSLGTEGDTKYLLRDANGKEVWTNQAGLDSARKAPEPAPVVDTPTPEAPAPVEHVSAEPQPTGDLGTIARKAVAEGRLKSDADSEALGKQVADAINAEAEKTGMSWEEINKRVQTAWEKKMNSYKDAGLTKEQYDVALKAADELSLLRQRADPSLISKGQVSKFYSPRATEDTPFTQELVNEISRDRTNGLKTSELDLSTTPYEHAIHRYANASDATANQLFDSVERKTVKDPQGNESVVETGLKVSDETKQKAKPALDRFVEAQDKAIKAADSGDAKAINKAIEEADQHINEAIKYIAADLPNTAEGRAARDALLSNRGSYEQSTIRTNMFLNIANRAFDQVQKGVVNSGDVMLPIANRVAAKLIGGNDSKLATGFTANRLASKYARGSLTSQLNRNFKTNVSLAGAGAKNPLTKGIAKLDSVYRSAGTYLTSLGDTTTNAVRATNMAILGQAKAEGVTGAKELEKYLVSKMGSPEYQSLYHDMSNVYAGYIGMPETITGIHPGAGKMSKFLSKVDNAVKNGLENTPLPARAKQELNDFIQPALTGFAGATNRIFQKSLNAMALGIPQIRAGLKLAASGQPNAAAVGQMMIARSLIDAVSAGGVGVAGLILGSQGHWTGGYPSDPNERARWEKDGIQPDSFQFEVDGKKLYVQPGRIFGALALPLVIPAVVTNSIKEGTDPAKAVGEVFDGTLGQFMNNMGVDAVVQHIGDLAKLTGSEQDKKQASKDLMNMLGFSISNAVPASGLLNNVANATDSYKRDTSGGIGDIVQARNPFTRGNVDVKTDVLGNPIDNNTQLSLGSSAVTTGKNFNDVKTQKEDQLGTEINRLAEAGSEVTPPKGAKNADIGKNQTIGKLFLRSDMYKNASDKDKAELLNKVLGGTAVKDINDSLSDAHKLALTEYTLAGDKKAVWMENNDNAFNYYDATVNNKKANGTLTAKDMDLGQGKDALIYKYTVAKVNKEQNVPQATILGYSDTTKTEFNNMEDGEFKQKLLAYDQALEAAGLPSKFKNSKGGYGKLSGGRSKGFDFLTLPNSLVGTGDTAKSKYEAATPLFKPVADLKAPATVEVPKGRSISVKRGIQL